MARAKIISFQDFVGVVNTREPASLNTNELVNCSNLYVTPQGSLKARPGLEVVGTLASADFRSIGYFSKTGKLYLASGTELYEFDPSAGTFTSIGSVDSPDCVFVSAFDKLWIADGGILKYYDGTTFGTVEDFIYKYQNIGAGDGTTTTFTAVLQEVPVTPNSVSVEYTIGGVSYTSHDDGNGNISGAYISSGSINYQSGDISITFSTAPDNGTNIRVRYSNSDVLNVRAEDIEFKDEKLYVSYGTDIYISEVRDPSLWYFISINRQDGAKINAIHRFYDKLVVFKGYPAPAIYVLSGTSLSDYTVSRVARYVSANNKYSVSAFGGDLFFNWGKHVYSLSKVMGYGDVEPRPLTYHFNPYDTTSQERFALPIPEENVIFFLSRSDARDFAFTPQRNACTFLSFALPVVCGVSVGDTIYLAGGENVYKFSPIGKDGESSVFYDAVFPWFGSPMAFVLAKRFSLNIKAIENGDLYLYHDTKQVATFSLTAPALWDSAVWDSALFGSDYKEPLQRRQIIHDRFLKLALKSNKRFELFALYVDAEVKNG